MQVVNKLADNFIKEINSNLIISTLNWLFKILKKLIPNQFVKQIFLICFIVLILSKILFIGRHLWKDAKLRFILRIIN